MGVKLIEGILKKAENMQRLKDDEIIKLFKIEDKGDFNRPLSVNIADSPLAHHPKDTTKDSPKKMMRY